VSENLKTFENKALKMKFMKYPLLSVLIFFLFINSQEIFSQTDSLYTVDWKKKFGGDESEYPTHLLKTSDGGCLVSLRTNSNGNPMGDALLIKLDASFKIEWKKIFKGALDTWSNCVIETSDGNFVFTGRYGLEFGRSNIWIVKIDKTGKKLWGKQSGESGICIGSEIIETNDGSLIVTGDIDSKNTGRDVWLAKYDKDGNEKWSKVFEIEGFQKPYGLVKTKDKGYLIAIHEATGMFYGNIHLIKTNDRGNMIWNKKYGNNKVGVLSLINTYNDKYLVAGFKRREDNNKLQRFLFTSDTLGNKENETTFWLNDQEMFVSIQKSSESTYLFSHYRLSKQSMDFGFIKTDSNFNKIFDFSIFGSDGMKNSDVFITENPSGDLLLVCSTNKTKSGELDVHFIKMKKNE
jgi:hypothetical protein